MFSVCPVIKDMITPLLFLFYAKIVFFYFLYKLNSLKKTKMAYLCDESGYN